MQSLLQLIAIADLDNYQSGNVEGMEANPPTLTPSEGMEVKVK